MNTFSNKRQRFHDYISEIIYKKQDDKSMVSFDGFTLNHSLNTITPALLYLKNT